MVDRAPWERAVRVARREYRLRAAEDPPGSNWGPRVRLYLAAAGWHRPAPWCMAFVQYVWREAGHPLWYVTASVGFLVQAAQQARAVIPIPRVGAIACYEYKNDPDDWADHTGIVDQVLDGGWFRAIEGNKGNRVAVVHRHVSEVQAFVWPPGADGGETPQPGRPRWELAIGERVHAYRTFRGLARALPGLRKQLKASGGRLRWRR